MRKGQGLEIKSQEKCKVLESKDKIWKKCFEKSQHLEISHDLEEEYFRQSKMLSNVNILIKKLKSRKILSHDPEDK